MTANAKTKAPRQTRNAAVTDLPKLLLEGLPHAVVLLGDRSQIVYANPAAEQFFGLSYAVLRRQKITDLVTFGCPLLGLVDQVRRTESSVNEYGVEIVLPRTETSHLVDIFGGPLYGTEPYVMLLLQQRSMAQMIERLPFYPAQKAEAAELRRRGRLS